jgi:hypothetical protein
MSSDSDFVQRNISLSFDFAKAIVDDPTILEEIPDGATLVLLPDDDPELSRENLRLGVEAAERGENVYIRHVGSLQSTPQP